MRDLGLRDYRGFQRLWRHVDPATAQSLRFPEPSGLSSPTEVLEQIMKRLEDLGFVYAVEPSTSGPSGQMGRTALGPGSPATCIDVVVLTAAACVLAGLHPWVVVTEGSFSGHAWIVVNTNEFRSWSAEPGRGSSFARFEAWEASRQGGGEVESPWALDDLITDLSLRVLDPTRLCAGYDAGPDRDADAAFAAAKRVASNVRVCDVGYWWQPRWLHVAESSTLPAFVVANNAPTAVDDPMLEPRPLLDRLCDEWLESGDAGLLLVGQGGQGATSALRRIVSQAANNSTVLLVAAAPWNAARWLDHDPDAQLTVDTSSLGLRLVERLAVIWEREGSASARGDVEAVNAAQACVDRFVGVQQIMDRLGPGRDLLVVVDGFDPREWGEPENVAKVIARLHEYGRQHPHRFTRRLRTLVASERQARLTGHLNAHRTIDLDEVGRDPGEIAARQRYLARASQTPSDLTADSASWDEIALWLGDAGSTAVSSKGRMEARLDSLRGDRIPADNLIGVLLAALGPLPRQFLADVADLGAKEEELMDLAQPWLRGDGRTSEVELQSAARRWLLANDSTASLLVEGEVRLTRALASVDGLRDEALSRYRNRYWASHARGTQSLELMSAVAADFNSPDFQAQLFYREGPRAQLGWLSSVKTFPADVPVDFVWHDITPLVYRPVAGIAIPELRRHNRGAVFRAAGGERGSDTVEVSDLGLRIDRTEKGSGVVVEVRAPESWRETFIPVTVHSGESAEGIEVVVPLTDAEAPRARFELRGQRLVSHDLKVGPPLSVEQVAFLEPALLARSRGLPQSSRASRLWDEVDKRRRR